MKVSKDIVTVAFCVICFLFTVVFCGALTAVIGLIGKGVML
ncbi:hypothetical protein SNB24_14840 [Escherichia coli]|nr:hypothetical protein [Escherichia coli]MDZ9227949.1 hypothetical protein [Escherichia coli]